MGTRRSRHNKGRKPRYKDHDALIDARCLRCGELFLKKKMCQANCPSCKKSIEDGKGITTNENCPPPKFKDFPKRGGAYEGDYYAYNEFTRWKKEHDKFLLIYWEAGAHEEWLAERLHRRPITVIHRARLLKLISPPEVRKSQKSLLVFPYIKKIIVPEHEIILSINEKIPRGLPENMRADICQEALLSYYEGEVSLDDLLNMSMSRFIAKFYKSNYDRNTVSLSTEDDRKDYVDMAAAMNLTSTEASINAQNELRFGSHSMRTFTPSIQEQYTYEVELEMWREDTGGIYTRADAVEILDD